MENISITLHESKEHGPEMVAIIRENGRIKDICGEPIKVLSIEAVARFCEQTPGMDFDIADTRAEMLKKAEKAKAEKEAEKLDFAAIGADEVPEEVAA